MMKHGTGPPVIGIRLPSTLITGKEVIQFLDR